MTSLVDASCARPTRHRFLLLGGRFRPQVVIDSRTFDLKLSLRSFCSASGRLNLRTRRSIRDLRSISPFFFHVFSALTLLVDALRVHTGGIGPGLDAWEVPTTVS